jgi:hypothetical protein
MSIVSSGDRINPPILDLHALLAEHETFHAAIASEGVPLGELNDEQVERLGGPIYGQMERITEALELRGVSDLIHIVSELIMQNVERPPANASDSDLEDFRYQLASLMETIMMASMRMGG